MATSEVVFNWVNVLIGAVYIMIAVRLIRQRVSRKHRICLGVSISLEAHLLCVLLHKSIHDLFCGPFELYLNRTDEYMECTYNVDNPWVMGVDRVAVSGIFMWALAYLTEILISVEMTGNKKKTIRRTRTVVVLIEVLAGILSVSKVVPWAMLVSLGTTCLYVAIIFGLSVKAFLKLGLNKTEQRMLTLDLALRSLVYLTVVGTYWIAWASLKAIPQLAARMLYHVIVWIPLLPGLAKARTFSTWRIPTYMMSTKVKSQKPSKPGTSAKDVTRSKIPDVMDKGQSKSSVAPEVS